MVCSFFLFLPFAGTDIESFQRSLKGAALVSTGMMRPKSQVKALGGPCKNPAYT